MRIDIREDDLSALPAEVLETLLRDHTTGRNIFWATHDYEELGKEYDYHSQILPELITGEHRMVIRPRVLKTKEQQSGRARGMGEIFTPAWLCNAMINEVDKAWIGVKDVFNVEDKAAHTWEPTPHKIIFPEGKTWQEYVRSTRLEITCGEAPFLVSRYDAAKGTPIPVERRIGVLDRKLRLVEENTETSEEWLEWAGTAFKNTLGYEWQGDSLLLARISMFWTFIEYYQKKFHDAPPRESFHVFADIISWNLWQMDGLKYVVPDSCHDDHVKIQTLFEEKEKVIPCPGCAKNDTFKHNGTYCLLRDWNEKDPVTGEEGPIIRFVDITKH